MIALVAPVDALSHLARRHGALIDPGKQA